MLLLLQGTTTTGKRETQDNVRDSKSFVILKPYMFFNSTLLQPEILVNYGKEMTTPFLASFMTQEKVLKPKYKYRRTVLRQGEMRYS